MGTRGPRPPACSRRRATTRSLVGVPRSFLGFLLSLLSTGLGLTCRVVALSLASLSLVCIIDRHNHSAMGTTMCTGRCSPPATVSFRVCCLFPFAFLLDGFGFVCLGVARRYASATVGYYKYVTMASTSLPPVFRRCCHSVASLGGIGGSSFDQGASGPMARLTGARDWARCFMRRP